MRHERRWLVAAITIVLSGCGGGDPPPTAPTPAPASFVRMDIEGPREHDVGAPGEAVQLRAIATFSDGTRPDVTNEATWTVVDSRVVTVSRGVVTGLAEGGTIVTATYRGWSSVTNVRVARALGPRYPVDGVVRDAETGAPIVDATIRDGQGAFVTRTDGNGFFETHVATASFTIGQFGYADASLVLPVVTAPTTVDVRLVPNQGAYVERTVEGEFDTNESFSGSATLNVSTRAGGIFDAVVEAPRGCDYSGTMQITASSGGRTFVSQGIVGWCVGRLRFVVPDSQIRLTITGTHASGYRLTFREPR